MTGKKNPRRSGILFSVSFNYQQDDWVTAAQRVQFRHRH